MTLENLHTLLASTGMPVAYDHFAPGEEQQLPFICFICTGSDNFAADNGVYQKINGIQIELYTDHKDQTAEAAVEAVIPGFWDKTETYIDSERMYQIAYAIEVI